MIFEELNEQRAACGIEAQDKDEIVDYMLDMLQKAGDLQNPGDMDAARAAIQANEKRMSTGMQHGIAIPHAKTEVVDRLTACIAITKNPVDCSSVDGKPSRIFIMTLSPMDQVGPHIRFLSEIGRLLKSRKIRDRLLKAENPHEVLTALKSK